jgi:outer membrane protein
VKKSLSLIACCAAWLLSTEALAQLKLGYVDMQRAVKEIGDGKKAYKKLKRIYNRYQKQIKKKENAIKKFQQQLKDTGMMLTDEAKRQKAMEMQKMVAEFQQIYVEKQRDLQTREAKIMGPILKKLGKVVGVVGQGGDYTMIFEKADSRLLWAQPALDLTNEIIRRYNTKAQ